MKINKTTNDRSAMFGETKLTHVSMPNDMKEFLEDIKSVCQKHNMSISHEDWHGAFIIEDYSEENIDWLFNASKGYSDRTYE